MGCKKKNKDETDEDECNWEHTYVVETKISVAHLEVELEPGTRVNEHLWPGSGLQKGVYMII
jgi:hypothetical protein